MELTAAAQWLNDFFLGYDSAILGALHSLAQSAGTVLTPLMKLITLLGEKGLVFFILAVVFACFARTRDLGVCIFGAVCCGALITNIILKDNIARPRPFETVEQFRQWWQFVGAPAEDGFSFPSGHVTAAAAGMTAISLMRGKKWVLPSVLIVVLMGISRNYEEALFKNQDYLPKLTESLGAMVPQVIVVMIFSLFIALLLNQKFRGRTFARAVFFLPVLVATGPVLAVIKGDISTNGISSGEQFSALFQTDLVDELLQFLGIYNLNEQLTTTIQTITSDIFNLLWSAGIQILIFLAALQQIPVSAKEAASMEGATGWEFFCKITFPMISPMILVNTIYTVIDSFTSKSNEVMTYINRIYEGTTRDARVLSSAMSGIYFLVVLVLIAAVAGIISLFVFYQRKD